MSKLIRVNINLDNSHSLTDFPVDIYSGTTTGNTTNLVYAGVTTSPVTFTVDDSIIEFGLKLVSTGCLDQVLLIESPSVDCEICADFVEFFDPVPTPQTTQTVLESCINDLTFVVEYNNSGLNGSPCSGGHGCNRAVFDILANSVVLGQVNLNNGGGIHDDVNRPPTYPNYPGASSGDRYNALSITSQQAQSIASNSPNGLIDFSFDCACIWSGANQNCVGSSCHTDVSWVRIIKDMGLSTEEELYNGCPNGNFIEDFDPCPPQPSPTPSSSPVPNASPTPSSSPAPNSSPTPSPTPSSSPAPNASPTPSPTPSSSPAPNASPTPSPTPTPTASSTPTPTPSPSSSPTPTPSPTPSALPYSTFFRSTVKSNLGSDDIVDEYGNPGGFCDNNYLVNTRFYVGGANRNLHSSLESQNVYTDSNLTNPLPNGYYYCSLSSEESGGFTYSATPGDTHKYIEVQFGNGTVTTGVHNCSSAPGGGGNN